MERLFFLKIPACLSASLPMAMAKALCNVAECATPPKVSKHEMEMFEVSDLEAIFEALKTEPLKWQICTQLLISTGARRGEIMGLRWSCVDWKNNCLYLSENCVYTSETGAISTTLKTEESRYVTVSPAIMVLWLTALRTASRTTSGRVTKNSRRTATCCAPSLMMHSRISRKLLMG